MQTGRKTLYKERMVSSGIRLPDDYHNYLVRVGMELVGAPVSEASKALRYLIHEAAANEKWFNQIYNEEKRFASIQRNMKEGMSEADIVQAVSLDLDIAYTIKQYRSDKNGHQGYPANIVLDISARTDAFMGGHTYSMPEYMLGVVERLGGGKGVRGAKPNGVRAILNYLIDTKKDQYYPDLFKPGHEVTIGPKEKKETISVLVSPNVKKFYEDAAMANPEVTPSDLMRRALDVGKAHLEKRYSNDTEEIEPVHVGSN